MVPRGWGRINRENGNYWFTGNFGWTDERSSGDRLYHSVIILNTTDVYTHIHLYTYIYTYIHTKTNSHNPYTHTDLYTHIHTKTNSDNPINNIPLQLNIL